MASGAEEAHEMPPAIVHCQHARENFMGVALRAQRPRPGNADVDEVDVQLVDLGQEVRQAVQLGLASAPAETSVADMGSSWSCVSAPRARQRFSGARVNGRANGPAVGRLWMLAPPQVAGILRTG